MRHFQIAEHTGGDMPARFYIDGKRVSRAAMQDLKDKAYSHGRLECFQTVGKERPGGRTRRVNYSTAAIPESMT